MNDPWFTWYRGKGKFDISPCGVMGWLSTLVFALLLIGMAMTVEFYVRVQPWATIAHITLSLVAVFAFVRFAMARAEVINVDEVARDLKELKDWKARRKP